MTATTLPPRIPPGHWIVASKLEGRLVVGPPAEIYPCRCADYDTSPPAFVAEQYPPGQVPRCRPWVSKKGRSFGLTVSRCPCWGRQRDERLPGTCCSWHEHNPTYLPALDALALREAAIAVAGGKTPPPEAGTHPAVMFEDDAESVPDEQAWAEMRPAAPVEPHRRRWTAEELTCPCPTPWDGLKTKLGYHCMGCHTNWVNYMTATPHRRTLAGPCRPPESIRDCETGRALLHTRDVGGFLVWAYR